MSEVWIRLTVVAVMVLGALTAAWLIRRRSLFRAIGAAGLAPGIYFFTSTTCETCGQAREKLDASVGRTGYTEIAWQERPAEFARLGIDAVPAVVLVDEHGKGRLYSGQPERALARLDP